MKAKAISIVCLVAAGYTVWYMHFDKPWTNDGALSTIGLSHRGLFALWGILTFSALTLSEAAGYRRLGKLKLFAPLLAFSAAGMALTLLFRFEYGIVPDYYLHCAGSLTFSAVNGVAVFLLFLLQKKRLLCVITAVILFTDLTLLLIFKETGMIEVLPIFAGYLLLSYDNLRSEKHEASRTAQRA